MIKLVYKTNLHCSPNWKKISDSLKSIGKTVPLGRVKSSSISPFHFPINPSVEFWYEGENEVRIVKNEPFAADLNRIPFSKGVTIDNVSFSNDRRAPLASSVKFSPTMTSCRFTST